MSSRRFLLAAALVVAALALLPLTAAASQQDLPGGARAAAPHAQPATSGDCTTSGTTVTCAFDYTGASQEWTVPEGVTHAQFQLTGACGGLSGGVNFDHAAGGKGAVLTADLPVTPAATVTVVVGGPGGSNGSEAAGFNGGGGGNTSGNSYPVAGGGGGATDIRTGGTDLAHRVLVAGGGGGGGGYGDGDGPSGRDGPAGGAGGNADGNGAPGAGLGGVPGGVAGLAGGALPGQGGPAVTGNYVVGDGGGGGGGYTGGGSGGPGVYNYSYEAGDMVATAGGGGGGGTSYADPAASNVTVVVDTTGVAQAVITYEVPLPSIVVDPTSLSATINQGDSSQQTLTIANTGGSDLNWSITLKEGGGAACDGSGGVLPWWVTVAPGSGTTAAAGTSPVQVTMDSTGLPEGYFYATLCISSNDPDESVVKAVVNLEINPPPDFTLAVTPASQSVCAPGNATYTVDTTALWGSVPPVGLTVSGAPAGPSATFTPNPLTPPGSSTLMIGTAGAAFGKYFMTVSGTAGEQVQSAEAQLNLFTVAPETPALISPVEGSTNASFQPTFRWNFAYQADSFEIQVASDPALSSIVAAASNLTDAGYTPPAGLALDTVYYWRVRATNTCGTSAWSPVWAFRTAASGCVTYASTDVPKEIRDFTTAESRVSVPVTFSLTDVNVTIIDLWHSFDSDLEISIAHPDGTSVILASHRGWGGWGYVKTVFDDEASTHIYSGSPPYTGSFIPEESLSAFDGKPANGDWKLLVYDGDAGDGGGLNEWSIEVCGAVPPVTGDYTDLPATYGVAWHAGDGALRLGPGWTADTSFAPGADDATDDGVAFVGDLAIGQAATVRVNVQGTPANGRWLAMWLDWDRNGVFDPGELVYNDAAADGENLLGIAVPDTATIGPVNYRVRLYDAASNPQAMPWGGWDSGGEVEDNPTPALIVRTAPNIDVDPVSLETSQTSGTTIEQTLTIGNMGDEDLTWSISEEAKPATAKPLAPTDTGYTVSWSTGQLHSFPVGNINDRTYVGKVGAWVVAMDFDATATTLYTLDYDNYTLGKFDVATSVFTTIGAVTPASGRWTGLAIDPVTNEGYALTGTEGCETSTSLLYRIDLSTGALTLVGNTGLPCFADIAISPTGALYAYQAPWSQIYQVDRNTAQTTLVGSTGYGASWYAQGMDFDNEDGTLYLALFTGGGTRYGSVDLVTGQMTQLMEDPGQYGIAIRNTVPIPCSNPADVPWLSVNPVSGATAGGGSTPVTVSFNSTGMTKGDYLANLCISSNDPDEGPGNGTNLVVVPVKLTVTCVPAVLTATLIGSGPGTTAPDAILLTASVTNSGTEAVPAGIPINFSSGGSPIGSAATTVPLAPGESTTVSIEWVPPAGDLTVSVVPDPLSAQPPVALCEAPVPADGTFSVLDRPMYDMWNLVSFPVQPANTLVASVMTSVGDKWQAVLGWNGAALSYYAYLPPPFNTLQTMDGEHGYWIRTTMPAPVPGWITDPPAYATLRVSGIRLPEDQPLALDTGWNLVSYLPRVALNVPAALASIDGKYTAVVTFERGAKSYYPGFPSRTLEVMKPGMGYWINMTEPATLVYPAGLTAASADAEAGLLPVRQAEAEQGVQHTGGWADFAGRALGPDRRPYPAGTVLVAVDPQGTVCGATVVLDGGAYGPLACYGDLADTPADEGAQVGDMIRVLVAETQQPVGLGTWRGNLAFQRLPSWGGKGALPDEPAVDDVPAAN